MSLAPQGARIFPLRSGTKIPAGGRGHLDAIDVSTYNPNANWENYGIALDNQWIVVDVDDPDKWRASVDQVISHDYIVNNYIVNTWTQETKRGWHWLFKQPAGFKGKNVKLPNGAGDIKCNGYIVGPGSVVDNFKYIVSNSAAVAAAPQWLLDLCQAPSTVLGLETDKVDDKQLQVKEGEGRNQFLTRVAGSLRGFGLSGKQTKAIVRSVNARVCVPPLTHAEIKSTIDQSIEKWKQGEVSLDGPFVPAGWVSDIDVESIEEPISWWEWGFIPKNALVLQYGDGGIGKSTLVAWLAAKITRAGGRVGVVTREDPFRLFAIRARLSGSVPGQIFGVKSGDIILPRDTAKLEEIIKELKLDFLYFDSIAANLETNPSWNAGEKARNGLSPLAEIATTAACTIFGTFHTNKAGTYMGSTEMENVCRVLIKTTKADGPEAPLTWSIKKSNFKHPKYSLQFNLEESTWADPSTGEVQREEQRDGTLVEAKFSYAKEIENLPENHINMNSITDGSVQADGKRTLIDFLGNLPGSAIESFKLLEYMEGEGFTGGTYKRIIAELIEDKVLEPEGSNRNRVYKLL